MSLKKSLKVKQGMMILGSLGKLGLRHSLVWGLGIRVSRTLRISAPGWDVTAILLVNNHAPAAAGVPFRGRHWGFTELF